MKKLSRLFFVSLFAAFPLLTHAEEKTPVAEEVLYDEVADVEDVASDEITFEDTENIVDLEKAAIDEVADVEDVDEDTDELKDLEE